MCLSVSSVVVSDGQRSHQDGGGGSGFLWRQRVDGSELRAAEEEPGAMGPQRYTHLSLFMSTQHLQHTQSIIEALLVE